MKPWTNEVPEGWSPAVSALFFRPSLPDSLASLSHPMGEGQGEGPFC